MKGSRAAALLVGLTAVFALAACGVPPSGVIQAGDPASGMFSPSPLATTSSSIPLYFVHNDDVTAYARRVAGSPDLPAVVRLLFEGPTASEAVTATTQLPHLTAAPEVRIGSGDTVVVQLPPDAPRLSGLAMRQVECTVTEAPRENRLPSDAERASSSATAPTGARRTAKYTTVQVLGDGWTMTRSDGSCPGPLTS